MSKALQTHVRKVAKGADIPALSAALGALVKARLKPKPKVAPQPPFRVSLRTPESSMLGEATFPRRKRSLSTRRRGRNQAYVSTGKVDISRLGTFRHYMISLIRRHKSTWEAEAEHATCENPKFVKNKLDFAFMEREGYIEFIS